MATTDLHAHVHAHDYYADRPLDRSGLALAAGLIEHLRAGVPNSLLVDNGDFLQGNPMGDHVVENGSSAPGGVHPMVAAMNVLGYDAAALGNHEFNFGIDFLLSSLTGATFPVICANVVLAEGAAPDLDETLLPAFVILERRIVDDAGASHVLRVGLIGFLPPQIMMWDRALLEGRVTARDIVATARARLPQMRAAGADIVVALCHSGIGAAAARDGMENAATALAALPEIDGIVAGHSHLVFPAPAFEGLPGVDADAGTLAGKPAVMAGCFGSHVGTLDFALGREGGRWTIQASRSEAHPVGGTPADGTAGATGAVLAATRADHQATRLWAQRPVGRTTVPLNSFFAVLPGNAALSLVAEAQLWHVAAALRGTPLAGLPLLSAAAPFKMGGRGGPDYFTDVPEGDLALRNVADLYLYPNTIRAVIVTGAELACWLEWSACVFSHLVPGSQDQPLLDPDVPSSQFDVISGVTWEVDLSMPRRFRPDGGLTDAKARRIRNLRHGGRPVRAADRFVVATNNYRAGSGLPFPGSAAAMVVVDGNDTNRHILRRYIAAMGTIGTYRAPHWKFSPLPGTSALFDTSPHASNHLNGIAGLGPEPLGVGPGGFLRVRLRF